MVEIEKIVLSEVEKEGWNAIKKAKKIVITSHVHPDGDAIGSSLALAKYCTFLDKTTYVIIDDDIPEIYDYLDAYRTINAKNVTQEAVIDLLIIVDTNTNRIRLPHKMDITHFFLQLSQEQSSTITFKP